MKLRFKYGLQMLLRNPIRMIASLITAIAVLGIAGMCIFTYTYDTLAWERDMYFNYDDDKYTSFSISDNAGRSLSTRGTQTKITEEEFSALEADVQEIGGEYAIIVTDGNSSLRTFGAEKITNRLAYEEEECKLYTDYNGTSLFAPYFRVVEEDGESTWESDAENDIYYQTTVFSSEAAIEEFGYTLVGSYPQTAQEVAIPQWMYNCFLCYGYKDADGTVYEINSEDDIVGKTIGMIGYKRTPVYVDGTYVKTQTESYIYEAEIVGVLHVDYAAEGFEEDCIRYTQAGVYSNLNYSVPHLGVVVSREYFDSYRPWAYESMVRSRYIDNITVLRHGEHGEEYFDYLTAWRNGKNYFQLQECMSERHLTYEKSDCVLVIEQRLPNVYEQTAVYLQIVPYLGIFAAVLLMYLCFSTVMGKRRGVGILQSVGATKGQIVFTIGIPVLLFCLLCSLGALCVEVGFMSYMNGQLWELVGDVLLSSGYVGTSAPYPFTLSWQTWLFTFGVPIAIVAVTTLVTVWLVFRTPVVDNLNKKDFRLFRKKVKTNPFTDLPWSGT